MFLAGCSASYIFAMDRKTYELVGPDYPGNRPEDVRDPSLGWMISFLFLIALLGPFSIVILRKVPLLQKSSNRRMLELCSSVLSSLSKIMNFSAWLYFKLNCSICPHFLALVAWLVFFCLKISSELAIAGDGD